MATRKAIVLDAANRPAEIPAADVLLALGGVRTTDGDTGGGDMLCRHFRTTPAGSVGLNDADGLGVFELLALRGDGQPASFVNLKLGPRSGQNVVFAMEVASGAIEFPQCVTSSGGIVKGNILRPAALSAGTWANYSPTGLVVGGRTAANTILLSTTGAVTLSGLSAAQGDGTEVNLFNASATPLSLAREGAGSTAANRFNVPVGFALGQYEGVRLVYDGNGQRWVAFEVRPKAYSTFLGLVASASANYSTASFSGYAQQDVVRFSGTAGGTANIHGFPAATITPSFALINASSTTLVVKNQSATETTAANRFLIAADISIGPDKAAVFWYDATSTRWRCLSSNL